MNRTTIFAIAFGILLVTSIGSVGVAAEDEALFIRGEPRIDVLLPDDTVTPGTTDTLDFQIANDGRVSWGATTQPEIVTTARNVRVEVDDDDVPFTVETSRQAIGSVGTDMPGEAPFTIRVPEDAEPGEYEFDVTVRFSHTAMYSARAGVLQERSRTITRSVDVIIDDRARFDIRGIETALQVGDSGTVTAEVENVGGEPARDIDVSVSSTSPNVVVGDGGTDSARIDRLAPGETARVVYDARIHPDTTARNYSLDATVRFTDEDGVRDVDDPRSFAFFPVPEQEFALDLDESTLRVGEIGTIRGTVTNTGPVPVDTVTLSLADGPMAELRHTHAVGALDVGESAPFQLRVVVPGDAEPVPHRIDIDTSFQSAQGHDLVSTDPIIAPVGEQDFTLEVVESTLRVGEKGTIRGTVTNDGPAHASAVTLVLEEGQFEPRTRTYSIGDLDVNESAGFEFRATVPESTDPAPQRIDVRTEYRTPADEARSTLDSVHAPVAERRDAVAIDAVNPIFTAGESRTLQLEATNQRNVEIRDVRINMAVHDPLESDFNRTVIASLEPGETGTVGFDLEVDRDAPISQYPAIIRIEYTDPDDDLIVDRPATVVISVTETPRELFVAIEILIFLVLVVLVVAVFVWLYRR